MTVSGKALRLAGTVLAVFFIASVTAQLTADVSLDSSDTHAISNLQIALSGITTPIAPGARVRVTVPNTLRLNQYAPTICTVTAFPATSTRTSGNRIDVDFLATIVVTDDAVASLNMFCTNIGNPDSEKKPSAGTVTLEIFESGSATASESATDTLAAIEFPNDVGFSHEWRRIIIPNNRINRVNDISFQFQGIGPTFDTLAVYLPGDFTPDAQNTRTKCRVGSIPGESSAAIVEDDEGNSFLKLSFRPTSPLLPIPTGRVTMKCTAIRLPPTASWASNEIVATLTPASGSVRTNAKMPLPAIMDDTTDPNNELKVLFFTLTGTSASRPVASFSVDNFVWPFMENDVVGLFFPSGASVWPDVSCKATYMGGEFEPLIEFASSSTVLLRLGAGINDPPAPSTVTNGFPSIGSIADFNVVCSGIGPEIDYDFETTAPFTSSLRAIRTASRTLVDVLDPRENPITNALRNLNIDDFVRETRLYQWASNFDIRDSVRYFRNFAEFGRDLFTDFVDALREVGGDLIDAGEQIGGDLIDAGEEIAGEIADAAGDVYDAASDVAGDVADGAQQVGEAVVDGAQEVGEAVVDGAEQVGEAAGEAASDSVDAVTFAKAHKKSQRVMKTQQAKKSKAKTKIGLMKTRRRELQLNSEQLAKLKLKGEQFRAKMAEKFAAMQQGRPYPKSQRFTTMAKAKRSFKKMNVIEDVADGASGAIGAGADGISRFIRGTADVLTGGINQIPALFERGRDVFDFLFDPLADEFLTFLDISADTARRFRDELRSLQFLSRAADQFEVVIRELFDISEWPEALDDTLDEFRDLRADIQDVFMDISVPSTLENAWRRLANAGSDVVNEIRHTVGRVGSIGDLVVDLTDLVEEIPTSSLITVPLGGLFDVTDYTRCTLNNVATTFLRELANGVEVVLRVRVPGRVSGNSATISCSDVAVTPTAPTTGSIPSPITVETASGSTINLGSIGPVDILGTAQLGSTTRTLTHSSETSHTTGTLTLTIAPMGAAADRVTIQLPAGYLTPNSGDSTQCQASVGGVPVFGTSTAVTSSSISVSAPTLVGASMANLVEAPLEVVCSNVRRARFTHPALDNVVVEAFSGDSLVGSTNSASLSAVSFPNPMAGTQVTLTSSSVLANAIVTVSASISHLPFDIVADDRLILAIPSPWTLPTDGSVACTITRKDHSTVPVSGTAFVSGQEVTLRAAGDIAASDAPLVIACDGVRNPAHTLESSSTSGIYFGVKDGNSRLVMATTNGVTSHYSQSAGTFGSGTSLTPLDVVVLEDDEVSVSIPGTGLAVNFRSPITIAINDIIEVVIPDDWSISEGINVVCSQGGVRSTMTNIVDRDGLRVLQIALPVAVPVVLTAQTIVCTGIRALTTVGSAVLGLITSGVTTVQNNIPVVPLTFGTAGFTHSIATANSVGNLITRISSFPMDLETGSSIVYELPLGWRVNAGGATTCSATQTIQGNVNNILGAVVADSVSRKVAFTIATGTVEAGNDEVILTCTNIGAPNVATPQFNAVSYRVSLLFAVVGERNDGVIGAVAPADLSGKVTMTSSSVLAGALTTATFRISPPVVNIQTGDVVAFALPASYEMDPDQAALAQTTCAWNSHGDTNAATVSVDRLSSAESAILRVTAPANAAAGDTLTITCCNIRNPVTAQTATTFEATVYEAGSARVRGFATDVAAPAIVPNAFGQDFIYLFPSSPDKGATGVFTTFARPFGSAVTAGMSLRFQLPQGWDFIGPVQCTHKEGNEDGAPGTVQVTTGASVPFTLVYTFSQPVAPNKAFRLRCSNIIAPDTDRAVRDDIIVGTYDGADVVDSNRGILAPVTGTPSTYVVQQTVSFPLQRTLTRREAVRITNAVTNMLSTIVDRTEVFRQTLAQNAVQGQNILTLVVHAFPATGTGLDVVLEAAFDKRNDIIAAVSRITGASSNAVSVQKPSIHAMPNHCSDGIQTIGVGFDETGVDCGGSQCNQCLGAEACFQPSDCASGVCDTLTGKCQVVSAAAPNNSVTFYISFLAAPILAALIAYIASN